MFFLDEEEATSTAAFRLVTFRNHLVRLCGLKTTNLNGKLARVDSRHVHEATGRIEIILLSDDARPPVPAVPSRRIWIKPSNMRHACEYCLAVAPDGEKLQACGRCKTVRYCNAECQRADWARHKLPDCVMFSHDTGTHSRTQSSTQQ